MSFIQKITGLQAPSELPEVAYAFCDTDTQERWDETRRKHTEHVERELRPGIERRMSTDPAAHAMADQFEAEFLDTAKRGRRG